MLQGWYLPLNLWNKIIADKTGIKRQSDIYCDTSGTEMLENNIKIKILVGWKFSDFDV